MSKVKKIIAILVGIIVIGVICICIGYCFGGKTRQEEIVSNNTQFDLELLGEVEKSVVTVEEVEAKLVEIGELSTYSGEYTVTLGKEETRYVLERFPVWGTTNGIEITCKGIVKVGYDMTEINVQVDDEKIYISFPEAKLQDNYVIWDTVECSESNTPLNPIEFSQYQELVTEIEGLGLSRAKEEGIYQRAEEHLKVLVEQFLIGFDGYEIVYM